MFALAVLVLSLSDPMATLVDDLRSCGIDEKRALIDYRDDLQDRERGVTGAAPVSDEQMGCLATASATRGYYVEFADPSLNRRFAALYEPKLREAGRVAARQELAKRGLLDTAPALDDKQSLSVFAARVESFCGVRTTGLLKMTGPKILTIDPPTLKIMPDKDVSDQIECVLYTVQAADLAANGVSFGFIGNETYAMPKRRSGKRR